MRQNYSGNKKKKEEARRKKQEEKRNRRLNKSKTRQDMETTSESSPDASSGLINGGEV